MASDDGPRGRKRRHGDTSENSDDPDSLFIPEPSESAAKRVMPANNFLERRHHRTNNDPVADNINPSDSDQPRSSFCHDERPTLEELVKFVVYKVTTACSEQQKTNPELKAIVAKLQKYANPTKNYEASKHVAFVGRAGVGKSLTLSCVLDQPGIALDSKDPVRGTNLTHEYSSFKVNERGLGAGGKAHRPAYTATPVYFPNDAIYSKLLLICKEVFLFLQSCDDEAAELQASLPDIKLESGNEHSTSERPSIEEDGQKYNSGIEYLLTMLCSEPGFKTKEEIEYFFGEQHALRKKDLEERNYVPYTPDDEVLFQTADTLMTLIKELLQTRPEGRDANDLPELQQAYRDMSKPSSTNQAHAWRAMEKLVVSADHSLLAAGAILGDTPGISDSDQNVVDGTKGYMKNAGAIVLCATLARSGQDESLEEAIKLAVHYNKQRSTFLILTMIDEGRPDRTAEEKMSLELSPADAEAMATADAEKCTLIANQRILIEKYEQLTVDKSACYTKQTELFDAQLFTEIKDVMLQMKELDAQIVAVQIEIDNMPARIAVAQKEIDELRHQCCNKADQAAIEAENHDLRKRYEGKIRAYTKNTRDPDLRIIFVSGQEYKKHLAGHIGADPPFLTREGTGIPSVKRLLYGIATAKYFPALKEMALQNVPRLIRSAMSILSKKPLEQMDQISVNIESKIEDGIQTTLRYLSSGLSDAFEDHIEEPFGRESNMRTWVAKAEQMTKRLPGQHSTIVFKSFCRKKGNWLSQKKKYFWDRSIIEIYRNFAIAAAKEFQDACQNTKKGTLELLGKLFDDLKESLASGSYRHAAGHDDFLAVIDETQGQLHTKIDQLLHEQINSMFDRLHNGLVLELYEYSYVAQAMHAGYQTAASIEWKDRTEVPKSQRCQAAHKARVSTITNSILGTRTGTAQPNIFEAVRTLVGNDFRVRCSVMTESLKKLLKSDFLETVMEDFNGRHGVDLHSTDEDSIAKTQVVNKLREELDRIEVQGKRLVAKCEEWKRPGDGLM